MTERVRALEAIARTLEGAQVGVHQLAFAHLPVGAALRVAAVGGRGELPAPVPGLTSPLLGLTGRTAGPLAPSPFAAAPSPFAAAPAAEAHPRPTPSPRVGSSAADPGAAATSAELPYAAAESTVHGHGGDAGEEDTCVTGPVLVFAPVPEPEASARPRASAEADLEGPDVGIEELPTLHDAPSPGRPPGEAHPTGGQVGADPDAFDEPTFLGLTPASTLGEEDEGAPGGGEWTDAAVHPATAGGALVEAEGADEESTLADSGSAFDEEGPFGPDPEPARDPAAAFADGLEAAAPDAFGEEGEGVADPWGGHGVGGAPARAGVQLRFIRPELRDGDDDPFADAEGRTGAVASPLDDGGALFDDDDEDEATRVGAAAVSLRAAVDAALRVETHKEPIDADFDGDHLEFESSAPAPAPARPPLAAAAAPARVAPAMSVPRLGAPRVVEGEPERPEGATGAAIQILGFGKARTLTPTLALEGAPDEADGDGDGDGGFSVAFEEPDEESTGPRIPMLTEGAPVPERPTVGLSAGGAFVAGGEPALAPQTAAGFLARARTAEQAGNLREAVECYGDLLSFDPYSLDAHLGRGRCLVDLGDYGAAMSDFTRAEDLAPDSPEPVVEMGNLYFARKEYKKAIAYYDHAIEQSPNHAMALCRRGICYYHRKRMSEAHADLKRAEALGAQVPGLQRYIQMTARAPTRR